MLGDRKVVMNELALFAGAGGGILGGHLLGWRTVCAVEWEPYPASVLCARQNDGLLPPFPIWDDVQTFDGFAWRGLVDVVSGGFPCQDISAAGKGDGLDGERSGMWRHMARVVGEVRPKYVFVENSPMLTTRGGTRVVGDLAQMGYDCKWTVMGAADVGANHQRDRMWIVGKSKRKGLEGQRSKPRKKEITQSGDSSTLAHTEDQGNVWGQWIMGFAEQEHDSGGSKTDGRRKWWEVEPNVGRVADGVAARVDRLKAIGNGQVPLCAATAWRLLSK
jgi:DNA (cytosine-5)-methyltransferase 1